MSSKHLCNLHIQWKITIESKNVKCLVHAKILTMEAKQQFLSWTPYLIKTPKEVVQGSLAINLIAHFIQLGLYASTSPVMIGFLHFWWSSESSHISSEKPNSDASSWGGGISCQLKNSRLCSLHSTFAAAAISIFHFWLALHNNFFTSFWCSVV